MTNSRIPAELKNCKLENPSLLLAQFLEAISERVLSPCVTYVRIDFKNLLNTSRAFLFQINVVEPLNYKDCKRLASELWVH